MHSTEPLRFMILTSPRTGSNLLLSLLSAHPAIKTYGEIFNLEMLPRRQLTAVLDDPIAYLHERVYGRHRPEIAAVGFKMFYRHMSPEYFQKLVDPGLAAEDRQERFRRCAEFIDANYEWPILHRRFRETWECLIADQQLAVIHLTRRNILNTLISHKTAVITGQWWRVSPGEPQAIRVQLEADECRRYFETIDALVDSSDAAFAGHRKLDVVYETLVERREDVLRDVFGFLGVPYHPVSTRMVKQAPVRAADRVENFAELKKALRQTKWSPFFDED
jgi:LPS sulfotransferase NodH